MSPAAEALYNSAMSLPEADRRELAEQLLDASLEEPPCPELRGEAYLKEIQRRSRETDPSTYLAMDEFKARVRARFGDLGTDHA